MKNFVAFTTVLFLAAVLWHQVDAGVSSCYKCTGACTRPTLESCPTFIGEFSCYSAKLSQPPRGDITYSKGCAVKSAINVCSVINREALISCYYCNSNNCNNHD